MKYFTISEMLYSPTAVKRGIWNGCNRTQEENLVALVDNVLDPAREKYGKAVHVSSGYRCQQLNTLIHGALESQHLRGEAADLTTDAGPQGNLELARLIIASGKFDQVILENVPGTSLLPAWLHGIRGRFLDPLYRNHETIPKSNFTCPLGVIVCCLGDG